MGNGVAKFRRFLAEPPRLGQWISTDDMEIYIRFSSIHYLPILSKPAKCIDLGNISVIPEKQNKGVFTRFLDEIEPIVAAESSIEFIFIENVLTERFANFLRKRGYTEIKNQQSDESNLNWPTSFYKAVDRANVLTTS